jgi:hypothetical protein
MLIDVNKWTQPMNATDRERLRNDILNDVDRKEEEIEMHRARIVGCESEIEKLKMLADYLLQPSVQEAREDVRTGGVYWPEKDAELVAKLQAVTPEQIAATAAELMRWTNAGIRAIDVAKALVPGYSGDVDARNFENRIYSLLGRQKDRFAKVSRGLFTVAGLVGTTYHPKPDAERDSQSFEVK